MARLSSSQIPRHFYALTTGIAAGAIVGSVGWGGAQVLIPALTVPYSFANYSQLSATGISLTSLSTSTLTSGWKFWKENQVHVPIAVCIGVPAVLSARLGTLWAKKLSENTLALIFNSFSIVLLPTHFWIQERAKLKRTKLEKEQLPQSTTSQTYDTFQFHNLHQNSQQTLQFVAFGFAQGILSSLMGVGGLPMGMSFLTEFTDLDHHHVQGTAICAVIPSILTSAVSRIHAIPMAAAGAVCIGAIVGGYGGAKAAIAMDDEQLRSLYMGSLLLFGGRSVVAAASNLRRYIRKGGVP